ncbi:reverse transcriptase family protein [Vibrio ruber]|uniref:reverse transcriptase family protein n=1 Tax=Vibrio ruber TaxID=184755 RepID=UPI002892B9F1|nr:reverse transcriptase family protein [Vibrio ruber]WNJ97623.1 reverse transcriptase family protein [Vibrio ruber]
MSRKSKLKIDTKNKSYSIIDSPFYKLLSKKKLAALLKCEFSELKKLRDDEGNYSEFEDIGKSGKPRKIQKPSRNLDIVHTRIASLLSRISTPTYLHSGKKEHSNVTNAKAHLGTSALMTTDIRSFFPSTSHRMIFSFFYGVMKCSSDVAELLADLCTCHKHLPTGSRISMPLAYWANCRMFEELNSLSSKHCATMTVYVDDLTFSGSKVNKRFTSTVNKIISKHGHTMHPAKTKLYSSHEPKLVTGVVVDKGVLRVRNEQHLKLCEDISLWSLIKDEKYALGSSITSKLIGRLNAMGTIETRFKSKAKSVRNSTAM